MKTFALIFRMDIITPEKQPTPEQIKIYMTQWTEWINEITEHDQLVDGNHFSTTGRLLKTNNEIVDTPYVAENNSIAGYILISAKNIDDAVKVAKKCPILLGENTSVEIRETATTG